MKELEAIDIVLLILDSFEFSQIFTDLIAHRQLPVRSHYLVVLLIFQLLFAQWVVTSDLPTLLLMSVYL